MSVTGEGLEPIVQRLEELEDRLAKLPRFVWATVTATSPLTIRVDGDVEVLNSTPARTIAMPSNGDRVYCVLQNGRCTIIGRAGG